MCFCASLSLSSTLLRLQTAFRACVRVLFVFALIKTWQVDTARSLVNKIFNWTKLAFKICFARCADLSIRRHYFCIGLHQSTLYLVLSIVMLACDAWSFGHLSAVCLTLRTIPTQLERLWRFMCLVHLSRLPRRPELIRSCSLAARKVGEPSIELDPRVFLLFSF